MNVAVPAAAGVTVLPEIVAAVPLALVQLIETDALVPSLYVAVAVVGSVHAASPTHFAPVGSVAVRFVTVRAVTVSVPWPYFEALLPDLLTV